MLGPWKVGIGLSKSRLGAVQSQLKLEGGKMGVTHSSPYNRARESVEKLEEIRPAE